MIGDFESGGGFPISTLTQNTKMYLSGGANKWSWAKQMEAHLGGFTRHGRVFYDFKAGETYTLVVSGRSKRFNVDRMILRHESVSEEIALDPQTPESIRPGDEASYRFEAISDFPSLNSGEAPYYMEEARGTLAINAANPANRGLFARAAKVFEGESGLYTFKLTTLTEEDGESIYRIRVNGAEVASFQNPYIGPGSDLDLKSNAFISELIPLNQGDTIWIESNTDTNGEVPEGEGTAWARGRWSQVELFLFSQEVPGTIEIPSRLAEGQGLFSPFELATDSGGVDYIATPESGALKNDLAVIESSGFASYRFEATADTDVTLRARVAAPSESSNSFWFRLNAGPWQLCSHDNREWAWVNLLEGSTTIETGVHTLEIAQRAAGARISAVRVQSSDPVLSAIYPTYGNEGTPGSGDAWVVSDSATTRIEAENYNRGGAGNAYLDADPENRGGQYRDDEVDVGKTSGGDYFVNFTGAIEWLDYTVDVVDPGVYQLVVSGARGWNGSANLNVLFDGENKAGELLIGSTGDFQNFAEVVAEVTLDSGIQTMRLDFASGGQNIDWVELRPVGLKQPWESSDVGSVALGGSANSIGSLFNLTASGADIYGRADEFQFVFQPMQGDGQIIARVDSLVNTNQWAKAGLMMRERLDANSKNVLVATTPANRLTFQSRSAEAGLTQYMAVANPSVNAWLRLTRAGDRFTADYSTDGIDWTPLNEAVIPMEEVIYIGMAATSHNNNALTTANFSQVSLSIETPGMDADGDGMPDAWELAMLGGTGFDPHRDEDGDGFTNLEEYTSGTDPMDGNARLRMKKISAPTAENGLTIRWDSAAGRHYRILVKEDLSSPDPWVPLSADLEGTGNEMSLTDPDTSMPKKFYKLEVWVP